ncbi:IS1096 element passenger TnpR family protein [Endozoicomonas sp.]|uniref:IS1096 element passenger TnpR family protein n=1 Tax=Endozoicomonas sp. TaxID=1892382 RepID=UPI00288378B4|nr:hypothetical protein [Endozoicomonas sp.]
MIISLNIKLIDGMYFEEHWKCEMELDDNETLEDLHFLIQEAVGFKNDHLYEFYVARTDRSFDRERFEHDDLYQIERSLKDIFPLAKNRKLFYWFDYGDDWKFQISRTRKKPKEPKPGQGYPTLVSEEGVKPTQYPTVEC